MPIRNLIFDLGNVIIDLDLEASDQLIRDLVDVSVLNPAADDLEMLYDYECGQIEEALFLNHFIKKGNGRVQAIDLINGWTAMLLGIPKQRLIMLRKLMSKYRVYFLSNTNETHIRWLNNYLQEHHRISSLDEISHGAYFSHILHARKPELDIYHKVIEQTDCKPEETLFFDDLEENIEAAKSLHFHGILVSPRDEIVDLIPRVLSAFDV